ncbi:23S rRNA (uracil(1939)-C(5))-methyltransferase RlmD [Colwellia sp. 4_MG-2023]|uniref:23S rRNA (uracil(1939)-C(5))-methyltransferase RlmD n=1 Tax=unclassified Colwellia TaxID=196834 RepID=UPI001C086146|nr:MULTISPECIES: 23S rRNA (uracil(1939)-C(5))-methyltransferase RlmD [unclassified Colwellia]MBU2923226.1 23S rRNA (uracil(1939)-C(5))-methyltransferase RlmD [Colwellia sp. C2M11]MDO6486629.1 23S rRNA (uracil(1939)-C(5))-methyltransferase RlmD [Colwellia sp. 6_MG-2023]MDO6506699.1 23S rRNA (uracil(1939)-C(5))-methyltransferase RlmD [Colwellia sp. 5_MG-2023]MDO6555525.1 23S rRNA (uracil(1939)-C(5))-methyltransferase RlmD [Colwellia sp. 4_MG-2023]MDO6651344.1 23S rRNA (uracil(1939)-C(5))-methylt
MANFFQVNNKKSVKAQERKKLTVKVERLDSNGCGVAYYQSKPVFIPGSLPNESVDIKIVEQKNKYALAKLLTINKASQHRVVAKCQHFTLCGGCDIQQLEYSQQLDFKKNKIISLFSRAGVADTIVAKLPWQSPVTSSPWEYRRKARIGVQFDKNAHATIGFRQKSTNQLVAVKSCPVLVEPAANIFPLLKTLINKLSVKKAIGHIEVISTEDLDDNELVPVDINSATKPVKKLTLIIRQIRAINEHDHQLWQEYAEKNSWEIYFQTNDSNNENVNKSSGNLVDSLRYRLVNGIQINFSSTDFIQINQQVNLAMVEQALDWLSPQKNDNILDLFCGLGNFSLPLAQQAKLVIGVEGVQSMVNKASANAKFNQINNCHFFQADLNSEWLSNIWAKNEFNKVLLDPARAGAELAVEQVIQLNIPTVLYVSCDPTTLARDSQVLISKGYKIEKIGLIDMFSQTKHVETMVLFSR